MYKKTRNTIKYKWHRIRAQLKEKSPVYIEKLKVTA